MRIPMSDFTCLKNSLNKIIGGFTVVNRLTDQNFDSMTE